MNEPYTYENPVSEMTENELFLMRTHGKHPADRVAAAAELRRREQAGPTPKAGNLRPVDIRKDNDTWLLLYADRETAYLAAEAAAHAPELAAENERLRGLLAQMTDIIDHLLSQNTDNLMRAGIEQSETLTPANLAAIEAAKEATNAK